MKLPKNTQLENLTVIFLEVTSRNEMPKLLKQVSLSFSPTFAIGDKINFQKVTPGVEAEIKFYGDEPTHEIKNLHWSITDFDSGSESNNTVIHLIVSLRKITKPERVFLGPSED